MAAETTDLATLADRVGGLITGDETTRITDVHHDSSTVTAGSLFVAIVGASRDGHDFVDEAAARGAAAVCVQRNVDTQVPQLLVADTRAVLGPLAAAVHFDPSRRLRVVGITGTNGKTTVAWMLGAILKAAGMVPGISGTLGAWIGADHIPHPRTSPEASDFQRLVAAMVAAGVDVAAVEVSSHALALGRVAATRFEVAGFTNLSQDHLDFHHDMEDYFGAKSALFDPTVARFGVVCVDDAWGRRLADHLAIPALTVGHAPGVDVQAREVAAGLDESSFTLAHEGRERSIRLAVGGDFNVGNALVAAGCAVALGLDVSAVVAGLDGMDPVPGRFEPVRAGQPFAVIVDYAHTPDGIRAVLAAVRRVSSGRVIVAAGAGGDRDRSKRAGMGEAAAQADVLVLTSDNPRSEDPDLIIDEVAAGAKDGPANVLRRPDRRTAIREALAAAGSGDAVLILGKGHEQGQEIAGSVLPFDDRAVAREELAACR